MQSLKNISDRTDSMECEKESLFDVSQNGGYSRVAHKT